MDCEKFDRIVLDLLYGELDELPRATASRHTEHCSRCRHQFASLKATREAAVLPQNPLPSGLEASLVEAERRVSEELPFRRKLGRWISISAGYAMRPQLAMASLLVLMIGASLVLLRGQPGVEERMSVVERGVPEGEPETVAIVPLRSVTTAKTPAKDAEAAPKIPPPNNEAADESLYQGLLLAFREGKYETVLQRMEQIELKGQTRAPEIALLEAEAIQKTSGCGAAAPRFDQVRAQFAGTRPATDAGWKAAECYRMLSEFARAKEIYLQLAHDPTYKERAQANLNEMGVAVPAPLRSAKPANSAE